MSRDRRSRSGIYGNTLVEVMVATVILAVVAVGGGAYMYLSRSQVAAQRVKRGALEAARSRLEDLRASAYTNVIPPALNYSTYYLSGSSARWTISASDPGETVNVMGHHLPMVTTVRYMDVDGGTPSYDCLRLTVDVRYGVGAHAGSADAVLLDTFVSPVLR